MFNAMRQLGGAVGVALLTTAIVIVGATHNVGGHAAPNLDAYRVAFVAATLIALAGIGAALTINDAEAANTMPARRAARRARSNRAPAEAAEEAPQLAG
jgi:hypothetical protein